MNITIKKPDNLGVIASVLCFLHCLATPLLFALQATSAESLQSAPFWWKNIDFLFLGLGFLAIFHSSKKSTNNTIKIALWSIWILLALLVINEKVHFLHIPEIIMYVTALSLSALHIYNLKYCQCKDEHCCASK